ncbi:hypothetical protein [Streptomyces sp. NPDC047525]|uniref:hypothetical protein n=1 Tax=Streptomyces sp. NPDC047525 TaxID=3155264 RepID=UPI0033C65F01
MSKSDFIREAARQLQNGIPLGTRTRGEVVRLLGLVADDDGHIPEEPEARRCAVRIAEALGHDQAQEAGPTAWSRLTDLHRQQREAAVRVAGDLIEALRAMYPAARALIVAERNGEFVSARLVGADRTVSELGPAAKALPPMPTHLHGRWPDGALARVKDLDDVIATLWACGLGFDDLPSDLRGRADSSQYIPALLLCEDRGCEYGCC